MKSKHPRQPVEIVDERARFKANPIVVHLFRRPDVTWEMLDGLPGCTQDDHSQFRQLLGCSLTLYSEVECCRVAHLAEAELEAETLRDRADSAVVLQGKQ